MFNADLFFLFSFYKGKMLQNGMRKTKQMQLISDQIQFKITLSALYQMLMPSIKESYIM